MPWSQDNGVVYHVPERHGKESDARKLVNGRGRIRAIAPLSPSPVTMHSRTEFG